MSRLFISHATADRRLVKREFLGLLRALGLDTWFSEEDIQSTEHWERAILSGLESSKWFVLIMSRASALSEWVKDEVAWAIENRPKTIVPILIDNCNPRDIHIRLPRIQRIDYRTNHLQAAHKLIKLLVDAEYAPNPKEADQRLLSGSWISAVQPIYYAAGNKWHIQDVQITPSPDGYVIETVKAEKKLQWHMAAKLVGNSFLVGPWESRRKSSQSQGYMSVQIARNGQYMFGHDYGVVMKEEESHFGILLFGRNKERLQLAWKAMHSGTRRMLPMTATVDFRVRVPA